MLDNIFTDMTKVSVIGWYWLIIYWLGSNFDSLMAQIKC